MSRKILHWNGVVSVSNLHDVNTMSEACRALKTAAEGRRGWHVPSVPPITLWTRPNPIHMRQMHKACVQPSISLSLSLSLPLCHTIILFFFSLFPPSLSLSVEKDEKIKVGPPNTWSRRRINFHTLVLSDPLTLSRNVALSSQVIYMTSEDVLHVYTGPFVYRLPYPSPSYHTQHSNPYRKWWLGA